MAKPNPCATGILTFLNRITEDARALFKISGVSAFVTLLTCAVPAFVSPSIASAQTNYNNYTPPVGPTPPSNGGTIYYLQNQTPSSSTPYSGDSWYFSRYERQLYVNGKPWPYDGKPWPQRHPPLSVRFGYHVRGWVGTFCTVESCTHVAVESIGGIIVIGSAASSLSMAAACAERPAATPDFWNQPGQDLCKIAYARRAFLRSIEEHCRLTPDEQAQLDDVEDFIAQCERDRP